MDCARVMRDEITEQYLAGRLNEEDREAFEAHYFVCERCFEELKAYQLVQGELDRSAGSDRQGVSAGVPRRMRSLTWVATAAVVVLGVVIWTQWPIEEGPRPGATAPPATPDTRAVSSLAELSAVTPPAYEPVRLRSTPDRATRRFREAMALYQQGNYAGTIAGLNEADRLGTRKPYVHFYLGASYLLSEDPDRAIRAFEVVVAIGESAYLEEAHFYLAKALLRKGDVNAARVELEKTIALGGEREAEARTVLEALDRVPKLPEAR